MTRDEYKTEDRPALEQRFRVLGAILLAARDRVAGCDIAACATCLILSEPPGLPSTIAQRGFREPRQDLERGVEIVAQRIADAANTDDAETCPGGLYIRNLYRSSTA